LVEFLSTLLVDSMLLLTFDTAVQLFNGFVIAALKLIASCLARRGARANIFQSLVKAGAVLLRATAAQ